ncbi:MAG: c-type cytochrome, partial [Myxococcales bacterium]|nr:c-type cytochrome [Myxococcales bacterium]
AQGAAPAEGTSTEQAAAPKAKEPIEPLPAKVEVDMDKVLLGRALFHDNLLSGDDSLSCATCHSLDHGGAEPRKSSQGIRGQSGPINSPTVLNSAYNFVQFWDGRAKTLEEQAEGPVENPLEMGATWDEVVKKVAAQEDYKAKFDKLYDGKIDKGTITHAIAEYERSLVTPSRFDRFLRGDASAITEAEKAGYTKFKETGCPTCHTGVLAGGTSFQKMGLVKDYFKERGGELTEADQGRFNVTKNEADRHHFKVPTLRNVELTPPYFHDGSHETLEAAVKTMARVQLGRELSDADAASIAAFLRSLTGELPAHAKVPAAG